MNEQVQDKLLRLTKLFISMGYFVWSEARNLIRASLGIPPSGTCVAVHYHAVAPKHRKRFARQMNILMLHAKPIAGDHKQPLQPGQHYVVVTFDDGFMSAITTLYLSWCKEKSP
jgi:hypothetical protein